MEKQKPQYKKQRNYSGHCAKCGLWQRSLHRDHILAKCRGGLDVPENIQYLCANCHEDKSVEDRTNPTDEMRVRLCARRNTRKGCKNPGVSAANERRTWTPEARAAWDAAHPKRTSGNCIKCGVWRRSLHRDHIVPKVKGGSDLPENIQHLCGNCHLEKTRVDVTNPSDGVRQRMRDAKIGGSHSNDHKAHQSQAQIERYADPAERAAQSERLMGHDVTDATRKKIAEKLRGRQISVAHRAKLSQALQGRRQSPEVYAAAAAKRVGSKRTPETRARMREAQITRTAGIAFQYIQSVLAMTLAIGLPHAAGIAPFADFRAVSVQEIGI